MNRGVVAAIAIAVLGAAILIAETDHSRHALNVAMGLGLFASIIILIGIISQSDDWGGHSTRGDTHQETHIHMPAAPQYQQPQYQPQMHPAWLSPPPPPAAPQIVMLPSPAPAPAAPQMMLVTPEMLAQMQQQGYLPHHPVAALPAPQYRGALDVVAEPVRHVQLRPVSALPSPSMASRVVGRMFGGKDRV